MRPWCPTWSPALTCPSPDSVARVRRAKLTREMGAASIVRCNAISLIHYMLQSAWLRFPAS
eukprot:2292532-Pyramimonas_sp.AAC.1